MRPLQTCQCILALVRANYFLFFMIKAIATMTITRGIITAVYVSSIGFAVVIVDFWVGDNIGVGMAFGVEDGNKLGEAVGVVVGT